MTKYDDKGNELSYVGMATCFYCGEPKNEIILNTRLENVLPRYGCYDKKPCDKCKEYMEQGIIVISVSDNSTGDNPYRTGGWWVVKEEALAKIFNIDTMANIHKRRVMFIEDSVCETIGLTRE